MFNFRLITAGDGTQIIDRTLTTPYEALTPLKMMEYIQVDNSLTFADRMDRQRRNQRTKNRNIIHKVKEMIFA